MDSLPLILLLCLISGWINLTQGLGVGINYGQIANNLPPPTRVVTLLQSIQINRVKLYDTNSNILQAFSNSNVEFVIMLGNENLYNMTNPNMARSWIQTQVQPYITQTKITCITVGNEVLTGDDNQLKSYLLPAMQNVYSALKSLGLNKQVTVTTAHSVGILGNSFPPSSGSFESELAEYLQPMLDFHSQVNSPFLINAYPFFAYKANPNEVQLNYVLFKPNPGMDDPNTKLHYDNMLYAQIDAVYSAIKLMGHSDIQVRVSETGWPSKGDPDEVGATPENAAAYNGNLLERIQRNEGTPAKPSTPIDVYVFALFNEDMKPGPTSERNYGLFYPDETPVYNLGFQPQQQQQNYLPEFYTSSAKSPSIHFLILGWFVLILLNFLLTLTIFI